MVKRSRRTSIWIEQSRRRREHKEQTDKPDDECEDIDAEYVSLYLFSFCLLLERFIFRDYILGGDAWQERKGKVLAMNTCANLYPVPLIIINTLIIVYELALG